MPTYSPGYSHTNAGKNSPARQLHRCYDKHLGDSGSSNKKGQESFLEAVSLVILNDGWSPIVGGQMDPAGCGSNRGTLS